MTTGLAKMSGLLRRKIRRYPRVRAFLIWCLDCYKALRWKAFLLRSRPVEYSAGAITVKLYPEGQIPEVLFIDNFEARERDFVEAYLRPGMHVVNIGANVGLYAVMASVLVAPEGEVIAFEPGAVTHERLLRNLQLNGCQNVSAVRAAISDVPGELLLRVDPLHPSLDGHRFVRRVSEVHDPVASDEVVEALVFDDYLTSKFLGNPPLIDFVIIDIEGAELAALQSARKTLERCKPTLLLECSKEQVAVERLLRDFGYQFWSWNQVTRMLEPVDFKQAAAKGNIVVRASHWAASS